MIAIIVAVAKNGVIGRGQQIPWYLPADLKRFKELTSGKAVIMGRRTFESILSRNGKPLPNRENIVITSKQAYVVPAGVSVCQSLAQALREVSSQDVFLIGGEMIYREGLGLANKLYITEVDRYFEGDVFMPAINWNDWDIIKEEKHEGFTFKEYTRKK